MSDLGPWGRRDGSEAERTLDPADAVAPTQRTSTAQISSAKAKTNSNAMLIGSTVLMIGFLWMLSGSWIVAFAVMFALFVHEYGHVLAMNRLGMGPARIYIIPFLGGLAKGQSDPRSEWIGVLVSLAGPAFGLLAMLPLLAVWAITGHNEWMVAAFFVAMLNLLNLVPAPPLDGARAFGPVLARIHPMLEKLVLLAIGVAAVWWGVSTGRYIMAAFLALAVWGHLRKGGLRSHAGPLSWPQAAKSFGLYMAVTMLCVGAAIGALLGITQGDAVGAFNLVGRYVGVGL